MRTEGQTNKCGLWPKHTLPFPLTTHDSRPARAHTSLNAQLRHVRSALSHILRPIAHILNHS